MTFLNLFGNSFNAILPEFFLALAILMIASSHRTDRKVHNIARLNEQVKELRSSYVETRALLMEFKMESVIKKRLEAKEIKPSFDPPFKIIIKTKSN